MQYLILIYHEETEADFSPEAMAPWAEFNAKFAKQNQGGHALQPVSSATTVRIRGGETQMTDGPFAETKEQLGGFYLMDCKDLDEALAIAAEIPCADTGSIEVRPIMNFDE